MRYAIVTISVILAGLLGLLAASCGAGRDAESAGPVPTAGQAPATETGSSGVSTTETGSASETVPPPTGTSTSGGGQSLLRYQVWFHRGEQLYVVTRTQNATPRVGAAALDALLDGPDDRERASGVQTQIPVGTQLLGLSIGKRIATRDRTSESETGGGTASMTMPHAQIVCTLDQFPTVKGVLFKLDGLPIDVLGGEGIVIDHPLTCRNYNELLPAILVVSPTTEESVGNPVTVTGSANVFEANVTVEVLDASGKVVGKDFTTATCGTGCRGTFSVTVEYDVRSEQKGTIVVHDDDAAGTGHPPHEVKIPVLLHPAS
jgi:hypothetical protein